MSQTGSRLRHSRAAAAAAVQRRLNRFDAHWKWRFVVEAGEGAEGGALVLVLRCILCGAMAAIARATAASLLCLPAFTCEEEESQGS